MKHMKKPLSILLTICMIVGLIPWTTMPALAESDLTISTAEDWNTFARTSATAPIITAERP